MLIYKNAINRLFALLSVVLFGILTTNLQAQTGNAPYSALGVGELFSSGFAPAIGMGDAGVSSANSFYINPINPALLVNNRLTTFDVGFMGQLKRLQDTKQNQQEFSGTINYLTLAIPAATKWTFAMGIRPYSSVDYEQNSYSYIGSTIYEAQYRYQGQGGLNKVFFSNGVKLGKSVSLGLETSYLFGSINKKASTQVKIGDGRDYSVNREDRLTFNDFSMKLGAVWNQKLKDTKYLNFGATYDPNINFTANRVSTLDITNAGSLIATPDTILYSKPTVKVPAMMRVGFSYEKINHLLIAFDYQRQNWSQYQGINNTNEGLRDAQSIHAGIEYLPNINSTKYKDFIWYRAGFRYAQTPIMVGTKPIDDISVSLGMSLPLGRASSTANISIVLGSKGELSSTTFRERYAKFVIGFSLKDVWFQKFKVD